MNCNFCIYECRIRRRVAAFRIFDCVHSLIIPFCQQLLSKVVRETPSYAWLFRNKLKTVMFSILSVLHTGQICHNQAWSFLSIIGYICHGRSDDDEIIKLIYNCFFLKLMNQYYKTKKIKVKTVLKTLRNPYTKSNYFKQQYILD